MSMIEIDLGVRGRIDGPFCQACGGRTRLIGMEAHPRLPSADIRTYECIACEAMQAVVAPHRRHSINAIVVAGGAAAEVSSA
jgi:hypothetical protein